MADDVFKFGIMPEALSKSELINLFQQKLPKQSIVNLDRNELIELASRLGLFPKPQRIPRDNRRGAVLKMEYETSAVTSGPSGGSSSVKRHYSATDPSNNETKRLKPAPCETSNSTDIVERKKIQLKKTDRSVSNDDQLLSASELNNGTDCKTNEKGAVSTRVRETSEQTVPKRRRHSPIRFP